MDEFKSDFIAEAETNEDDLPQSIEDLSYIYQCGRGGSSRVFLCQDKNSKKDYALKVIPKKKVQEEGTMTRVLNEKKALFSFNHPLVLRLLKTFQDSENLYFLTEFIHGKPLYKYIWENVHRSILEPTAKYYAAVAVLGLIEIHKKGFVHQDFKSGNLMLDGGRRLKIIDFGYVKILPKDAQGGGTEPECNASSKRCGTHFIMAPEMIAREGCDFAVDWWAFGVLVYEMLFGKPPWPYKPESNTPEEVEKYLNEILRITRSERFFSDEDIERKQISQPAIDFIKALLKENPSERLGTRGGEEVQQHPWFSDIDWDTILKIAAPTMEVDSDEEDEDAKIDPEVNRKYFQNF